MPVNALHRACGYYGSPGWQEAQRLVGRTPGGGAGADEATAALCREKHNYGYLPLHLAATLKADDLIRDLVAAGADPGVARKNGEDAIRIYEKFHSKPFPAE